MEAAIASSLSLLNHNRCFWELGMVEECKIYVMCEVRVSIDANDNESGYTLGSCHGAHDVVYHAQCGK